MRALQELSGRSRGNACFRLVDWRFGGEARDAGAGGGIYSSAWAATTFRASSSSSKIDSSKNRESSVSDASNSEPVTDGLVLATLELAMEDSVPLLLPLELIDLDPLTLALVLDPDPASRAALRAAPAANSSPLRMRRFIVTSGHAFFMRSLTLSSASGRMLKSCDCVYTGGSPG